MLKPGRYDLTFLTIIVVNRVVSSHDNFYPCKTCDAKMKRNQVPCQLISNNLQLDIIPDDIKCLSRLEIFLTCKMLLFKKKFYYAKRAKSKTPRCGCEHTS